MDRQRYLELIVPIIELVSKKGADYNKGVQLADYFPFGATSYVQMIHLKATRLRSIIEQETLNFDSAQDTVYDLINYCVFYLDYLEKSQNERL